MPPAKSSVRPLTQHDMVISKWRDMDLMWTRNCLDGGSQRVMVNGSCVLVESGEEWCPSGCVLGFFHTFHTFISDTERETGCIFSRFAGDTKLSRAVGITEGWDEHPEAPGQTWDVGPHEESRKFNESKCKVLQLHWGNPRLKFRLGGELIESNPTERFWGYFWVKSWT